MRAWVAGLGDQDRSGESARILAQLLLGERVLVDEIEGDWVKAVALDQPSSQDPRGYPGWLHADHLTSDTVPADGSELVVDATATAVRDAPFGDILLYGVTIGTRLVGVDMAYRGWTQVFVPGHEEPGWVRTADLTQAPDGSATAEDVLAVAERIIDAPYVWGGMSAYGVDCSGLVHLACRRHGVTLPRDAHDQAEATKEISLEDAAPGDLYFFARPGEPIHHVGFVAGERRMVHASLDHHRVVLEPLEGERADTLTGARRVLS
ncbi:MAG: glycoside hydrolase [Micromonosporaceae bacterium]|nr:glycoside hydrolase [Micromonosporaceae bacterium]